MVREPYTAAELEIALDVLRDMTDRIETRLQDRDWLVSDASGLRQRSLAINWPRGNTG